MSEGFDGVAGWGAPISWEVYRGSIDRLLVGASAPGVDKLVADEIRRRAAEDKASQDKTEADKRLSQMDALGMNQLPDGTVVRFTKAHEKDGQAYTYAALRTNGHWYLTGRVNGAKKTNEQFCIWLLSGQGFASWEVMQPIPVTATTNG